MSIHDDIKNIDLEIQNLIKKRTELLGDEDAEFLEAFAARDHLHVTENTVVCYQGVPGAYSHQAMHDFFGRNIKNINVAAFEDVIEAVKDGRADYGVLPIENSSAGFVNGIYDMVGNSDLTVVGDEEVKVAHALMGLPGARVEDIKDVYSHPQGLMQCSDFIDEMGYQTHAAANTAVAAVEVKNKNDISKAAIASELAAELHGLSIIKKGIVNNKNNTTRFVILSRDKIYVEGSKNVGIRFSLPDGSGTLYNILTYMNNNGINMTSIESRPLSGKKWEYLFFITFEGNLADKNTINALKGVYQDSENFKIIGTY